MIKDFSKYLAFRGDIKLIIKLKRRFPSLSPDTFYDLFQDSLLEKFAKFEEKFDFNRTEKEIRAFLYKLIMNQMLDKLKKQGWNTLRGLDNLESLSGGVNPSEFELDRGTTVLTFSEFLLKLVNNEKSINPVRLKTKSKKLLLPKHYELHSLIKLRAWSTKSKLSDKTLVLITEKIVSDTTSHFHYKWREPMSIVRLKCWVSCS